MLGREPWEPGKTTIALRFLLEGAAAGEKCLYITLSETEQELRDGAASHGWTIGEHIEVFELAPAESQLDADQQQTLLYSSDLELGEATARIFEAFERAKPSRVVLDSLSEIRLLAQSSLRYRRQMLALKHYFARHGATVLLLDDRTSESNDKTPHSIVHGVIQLQEAAPDYGAERRRLRVTKYRGQAFRGGYHDFAIKPGGVFVFPRLVAAEHRAGFVRSVLVSGIAELDALLGGGIERGSSSLILGPAGTGSYTHLRFSLSPLRAGEGKRRPYSFSTRNWAFCSIAQKCSDLILRACENPERSISSSLTRQNCLQANLLTALGAKSTWPGPGQSSLTASTGIRLQCRRRKSAHSPHARVDPVYE